MASESTSAPASESSFLADIFYEIVSSPLNLCLIGIITFLVYKILKSRQEEYVPVVAEPELPKLRKDFTVEELKKFNGTGGEKRILIAVNGKVFDVTNGSRFYGPGGPYSAFAGQDASRGLATFDVSCKNEGYDDLSDLSPQQMESVREWEMQFTEKYYYVGRLLRDGEQPTNYSDEEEEKETSSTDKSKSE